MPRELPISVGRLEELASKYGTPLQLYDEHAMRANAKYLFQVRTYVYRELFDQ
jgi:diaminopimelate decarboxylase